MAILNYSKTYQEVLTDLGVTDLTLLLESNNGNYVKLYFTKDGNIISHGINYLPLFNLSVNGKGLVPINTTSDTTEKKKDILRGTGEWAQLTTSDLPIWESGNYNTDTILNSEQVNLLVLQSFIANDAMRFKGVITSVSDITANSDRNPWKVGDTYRIGIEGTYFGKKGEIGDLLICVTAGTNTDTDYNLHWAVVQSNIEGTTIVKLNNSSLTLYAGSSGNVGLNYQIWGPTTNGYGSSQVLVNADNTNGAPKWATLSEGLTIASIGNAAILTLGKASADYLGGVKIDGLGKTLDKMTSGDTVSISSRGNIYLTATNISNALGFMPTNPDDLQDALTRADRTKDGLVPLFDSLMSPTINTTTWILGVNKGADSDSDQFGWFGVPSKAFTWRDIKIGGVSIEDATLELDPSQDVCINWDNDPSDNVTRISFGLSWYNISDGVYETT